MPVNTVQVKSILQKSNLPEADYVINPYTGCIHGCVYCYARFMKRFTNHPEPWGTFLDAKVNAAQALRRQLAHRREPFEKPVFLSSVTDPYQPPEKRWQITRQLLEVLLEYQAPLSILTKSDLVLRDIDLLKQFDRCEIGLSMMTLDDELARRLEPGASPPTRRLKALQTLHAEGVYTYAFVSPYLPVFSDIEQLAGALEGAIDEIGVEAINTRGGNWQGVEATLAKYYPDTLTDCKRLAKDETCWLALEGRVKQLPEQYPFKLMGFYRH